MERSILSSVPPTHPAPDATRYLPGMGKVAQPPSSSEFSTSLYTPSQNRRISSKLCGDALHAAQVHLALWARDNWEQLSVLHAPPPPPTEDNTEMWQEADSETWNRGSARSTQEHEDDSPQNWVFSQPGLKNSKEKSTAKS